ncbi:hypothetical protein GTW43_30545 [Streptomyces sp. SID5785]|uniref:hypothetical protein n=1 Tax=Streptomyces sp. SID5785 TaxID=2690309 RepID=UPI00136176DB|nr:hypothetical protein [Streptomyces sp. SID5785]MZD09388.1 hypothetical protein [Streptomyces sp. SID5785]
MANPGYGKRGTPDQEPLRRDSFAHLPLRARYLAGFVDALPENAAMDAKTLAKEQPLYGQMAVRTALKELTAAGHLRRVRRAAAQEGGAVRWVSETYWSRTARSDAWWVRFLGGDVPEPDRPAAPEPPAPRSEAYRVLAQLGLREPRLTLSAADCTALEDLAGAWLARDPSPHHFTDAVTAGLPAIVHAPRAFVARRLRDKLPPQRPAFGRAEGSVPGGPGRRTLVECTDCGRPGPAEALPSGLCRPCRTGSTREG